MIRLLLLASLISGVQAASLAANASRGEGLFQTLSCVQCHSVNGTGGHVAPDLGVRLDRDFTPATLASTMWNHAPTMWATMRERGVQAGDLNPQAAADLFAYFYSARFFEKPGDAGRGKALFAARACATCHGLSDSIKSGVKPVSQWDAAVDPIALTEAMWNHSPQMAVELQIKRLPWPKLSGQDLSDLLVYVRNLSGTRQRPGTFEITSGENAETIFKSKGCAECHANFSKLAASTQTGTLTETAAEMWNHTSKHAKSSPPPAHFESGEMRELLSGLWARRFFEDAGDPGGGKRVFVTKHCSICHEDASSGAPKLTGGSYTGSTMVVALWHHGPQMLELMKTRNIAWPRFQAHEMSDLIAYLNSANQRK
jgi:cytochrome c551/c552